MADVAQKIITSEDSRYNGITTATSSYVFVHSGEIIEDPSPSLEVKLDNRFDKRSYYGRSRLPLNYNPLFWFDPEFEVYSDVPGTVPVTNGQLLAKWRDRLGTSIYLENNKSTGPTYITNSINGFPVLSIGTNRNMTELSSLDVLDPPFTLFTAFNLTGSSSAGVVYKEPTAISPWLLSGVSTGLRLTLSDDGVSSDIFGTSTHGLNIWSVAAYRHVGSNASFWVNGDLIASTTNYTLVASSGRLVIGSGGTNSFLLGDLIAYNKGLEDGQVNSVMKFLGNKYNANF